MISATAPARLLIHMRLSSRRAPETRRISVYRFRGIGMGVTVVLRTSGDGNNTRGERCNPLHAEGGCPGGQRTRSSGSTPTRARRYMTKFVMVVVLSAFLANCP